jgi:hypothetical protein
MVGLLPRDVRGLDGRELRWVIEGRERAARREEHRAAWLVAELRNLGRMWAKEPGAPWTPAQVLGDEPRSRRGSVNSGTAMEAAMEEAARLAEERDRAEADGWFEAHDGAALDDIDLDGDVVVFDGDDDGAEGVP